MSLISTNSESLILQVIKKLLSFKADKTWVLNDAFTADDALEFMIEDNIIEPVCAADGTIYTAPNGDIYIL